jgi:hypothetical protein
MTMDKLKNWYETESIPTLIIFLIFCLAAIGVLEKNFVLTSEFIYQDTAERYLGLMSDLQVAQSAKSRNLFFAFQYPVFGLILTGIIFFYAVTIQPLVSSPKYYPKVPLVVIIRVLLISHLTTMAMLLTKVLYYAFFAQPRDLNSYSNFIPLSLASVFTSSSSPIWAVKLLQAFNPFELLFALSLGYGLALVLENKRVFWVAITIHIVISGIFTALASVASPSN